MEGDIMKKNKLVLTSGILMVVGAVACLLISGLTTWFLVEFVSEYWMYLSDATTSTDNFIYTFYMLSYILDIVIYLAGCVVFMIFGIKLIIKSSKKIPLDEYKGFVIAGQVLAYIGAGFTMSSTYEISLIVFGLLLASGILLSVALSKNKKEKETKINQLYGMDNTPQETQQVQSNSYTSANTNTHSSNNIESETGDADRLNNKIKSLQELKEQGVLSNDEYVKLIHKVLGLDELMEDKTKSKTHKTKEKTSKGENNEG